MGILVVMRTVPLMVIMAYYVFSNNNGVYIYTYKNLLNLCKNLCKIISKKSFPIFDHFSTSFGSFFFDKNFVKKWEIYTNLKKKILKRD